MSFLDPITASGPATALETNTATPVNVDQANPPTPGQVLTATDATHAAWQTPSGGGGGGSGGNAGGLETTGAPVDVSGAAPPEAGQVLMAIDAEHAQWKVPGLHYDPAIRFNVNAGGEATIGPGTWGFVYTAPVGASEIDIFVVSSLTAPPVDSRFGLYVSPSVTLDVIVSLIGASQIQAVDGTLDTAITLPGPGFYEWLFYHEDGSAIWGLVNYTLSPLLTLSQTVESARSVDFVLTSNQVLSGNSGVYDGVTVATDKAVLLSGQTDPTENGLWATHDGPWTRLADATPIGKGAAITDGMSQAGALWAYLGQNEWVPISVGDALYGNIGLSRNGAALNVLYGTAAGTACQGNDTRLSDDRVASGLRDTTGVVVVSAAAAPAAGQVLTATGSGAAQWSTPVVGSQRYKDPVKGVAIANITLSGTQTVDGVVLAVGDRVLVAAQTTGSQNGVYIVASGAWTRATDADDGTKLSNGTVIPVTGGSTRALYEMILTTPDPIVIGTTSLSFLPMRCQASTIRTSSSEINVVATAPTAGQVLSAFSGVQAQWSTLPVAGAVAPCRLVAGTNIATLSGAGSTIDGLTTFAGDRVLLVGQTTASQNGIWVIASGAWARAFDFNSSANLLSGTIIPVCEGTAFADTNWQLTTDGIVNVGTTNLTFARIDVKGFAPAVNPTAVTPLTSSVIGSSGKWADQNHQHSFPAVVAGINDIRISTNGTTAVPSDGTAINALFAIPYKGTRISLYSGSGWYVVDAGSASQPSIALSGLTANIPCDVFGVWSGFLNSWSLELAPWSGQNSRTTSLVQQDGVWCKSGALTRRYLCTILPNGTTTMSHTTNGSGATPARCGIWHQDNRIKTVFNYAFTHDTWSPTATSTWQAINGASTPQIDWVQGQNDDSISIESLFTVDAKDSEATLGIGFSVFTGPAANSLRTASNLNGSLSTLRARHAPRTTSSFVGRNSVFALAYATTLNAVYYGTHNQLVSGLSVELSH